jgi:hypothetical protein
MTFQINPDIEVVLSKFAYEDTYEGILEGNPDAINAYILRKRVPTLAANKLFGCSTADGIPLYIRQPGKRTSPHARDWQFPRYVCFALLECQKLQESPGPDEEFILGSRVAYCWFTDDVSKPISEIMAAGIEPFDWNAVAENWGI